MEKKQIDLKLISKMQKMPGGLVIIPLLLAVLVSTIFPQFFEIGGFTTGLFKSGQPAMMGLFLIICGSSINIKQVGMPLYKGVTLTGIKFLLGIALGLITGKLFGDAGIFGITPMVLIAAITNSNSSLYISLSSQFGDATDSGAISILSLNDGPFFTLVALGATGLASIPFMSLIATIVPILVGFVWGNVDSDFRELCKKAQPIVTFFMTIAIGSSTNIKTILTAGASGIVLGLLSAFTGVIFFFVFQLFLKKKDRNAMGAAIGTTALNSAMTPSAVAEADPSMAPYTEMATAQCATASIITLFLCPFIVAFFDNYMRKHKKGNMRISKRKKRMKQCLRNRGDYNMARLDKLYMGTNTKMNHTIAESVSFVKKMEEYTKDIARSQLHLFVIPPYTAIEPVRRAVSSEFISVGAQNMAWEERGQFTGEISPIMLKEAGADMIMVGHSERRQIFGETDGDENNKVRCGLSHGFTVLLCIGETAHEKAQGISDEILRIQLKRGLYKVLKEDTAKLYIAYEPVWAIGVNGIPASKEYAEEKHRVIKQTLVELFGIHWGSDIPVLYGGSVNPENACGLIAMPSIDGLFIGRSAWEPSGFNQMIRDVMSQIKTKGAICKDVE